MTIFKIGKGGALHVDVEEFPAAQCISVPNVVGDEDATLLVLPPASGVASAADIQAQIDAAGSTPTSIQVAAGTYGVLTIADGQDITLVSPARGAVTIGNPVIGDAVLRLVDVVAGDIVDADDGFSLYMDNSQVENISYDDNPEPSIGSVYLTNGSTVAGELNVLQYESFVSLRDSSAQYVGTGSAEFYNSTATQVQPWGESGELPTSTLLTIGSDVGSIGFNEGNDNVWTTDAYSLASIYATNSPPGGCVIELLDAGGYITTGGATNNIAATNFSFGQSAGLYRVDAVIEVTTTGTTGTAAVNVHFVDAIGASGAAAITGATAVITGTNRGGGSRTFYHDGSVDVQYSVSGVVTPGTLAYTLRLKLTKL